MSIDIEVGNVSKRFGDFPALNDVALKVAPGELLALLGPSGSGKTTLLRIIAGLDFPDDGRILFAGSDISRVAIGKRGVGFVFQQYALFRHMSVFENVAFGLRVKPWRQRPNKATIQNEVMKYLRQVQVEELAERMPTQISGGQRQRVALARALAVQPRLLLLDEPFGALDAKVRKELRSWLRSLHDETGLTTVFVTHDQDEAIELADRVAIMNKGRIEQIGTPNEVMNNPATAFVAEFIGDTNKVACHVSNGQVMVWGRLFYVGKGAPGGEAMAFVRPFEVELLPVEEKGSIPGTVRHVVPAGSTLHVTINASGVSTPIEAEAPIAAASNLSIGASVFLRPETARVFLASGDKTGVLAPVRQDEPARRA